jgi:hypothetical protein
MYTAHFSAYRTDLAKETGFRSDYDGAQDYDFALRFSKRVEQLNLSVSHVAFILYFWRAILGSTALSMDEKPNSSNTGNLLLSEFAKSLCHIEAIESSGFAGSYNAIPVKSLDPISIVIPTALKVIDDVLLLQNCISSIERSNPPIGSEIIIVVSIDADIPEIETQLEIFWERDTEVQVNIARKMNLGANRSKYSTLAFINDDTLIKTHHTLQLLAGFLKDKKIGSVAPKLLYPNFKVQCGGVALNADHLPDHIARGLESFDPGYFFSMVGQKEVTANTGAFLLVDKSKFVQVGGFDEEFAINYNDINFCMKLKEMGNLNLLINYLEVFHLESASRQVYVNPLEERLFRKYWQDFIEPYYPIHLDSKQLNYNLQGFSLKSIH